MDPLTILSNLKELGIAGIAVGAISYLCVQLLKQITANRVDYSNFVQSNNHTMTDLVKESTATMIEVKGAIQNHNEVLKILIDKIK